MCMWRNKKKINNIIIYIRKFKKEDKDSKQLSLSSFLNSTIRTKKADPKIGFLSLTRVELDSIKKPYYISVRSVFIIN